MNRPALAHASVANLLGLLAILSFSCTHDPIEYPAQEPLERIVVSSVETKLYGMNGIGLDELVSTRPFREKNLTPGMTATEMAKTLGGPHYMTDDRQGRDEVFGFRTDIGNFEAVRQHVSSEGAEVDRWFLRFRSETCDSLINSRVLAQVRNTEPRPDRVTVIAGSRSRGMVDVEFDENHECSSIWWLRRDDVEQDDPAHAHERRGTRDIGG